MKNFRFRLDTLLKVRGKELEILMGRLVGKKEEMRELKERKKEIEKSSTLLKKEIGKKRSLGDYTDERSSEEYLAHLKKSLEARDKEQREIQKEQNAAQEKVRQKFLSSKALEKLRERRYAHWKKELEKSYERRS